MRRGARGIGLDVYVHNPAAQRLYARLGFRPVALNMRKGVRLPAG